MFTLDIEVDFGHVIKGFDKVQSIMKRDVPKILEIVGRETHSMVRNFTPVDTGKLEKAWKNSGVTGSGTYQVKISNNTPYVLPVENGFQMHSHFVPKNYGAGTSMFLSQYGYSQKTGEGFVSPNRWFEGVHMAKDTSEIMGGRMSKYFYKVEQNITGSF